MNRVFLWVLVSLIIVSSINSAIINVPTDQPTIQAGIDKAIDGDSVLVADGVYKGDGNRDINFNGKAIVVISANGPALTIIDCEGTYAEPHRGFHFNNNEDTNSVVSGFTIVNGFISEIYIGGQVFYVIRLHP